VADPLTVVATVLGTIGTGIAIANRLWPGTPSGPRETVHECAGCTTLRTEVTAVKGDAAAIMLTLARMEGAAEERRQQREERARKAEHGRQSTG
jgi:hypothetical protein